MVKNKISIILKLIVSFGLLIVLAWSMREKAKDVFSAIKNADKILLTLAIIINIPLTIAISYRLKMLLGGQKIKLSMNNAVYLTFIGYFFNSFLPTAIGGDIVKAHYTSKKTNNKAASYAAVLADRIFGFVSTVFIAIIGLFYIWKDFHKRFISIVEALVNKNTEWVIVATLIFLIGAILLLKKSKILAKVKGSFLKLYFAIKLYLNNPYLMIKVFVLSLLLQGLSILSIYFFVLSLHGKISLVKMFIIMPVIWTISMIPVSLNGLGIRELAFRDFLKGDIGVEKAIAISILWLGLIMLYSLIGGVLHLLYPVKTLDKKEAV